MLVAQFDSPAYLAESAVTETDAPVRSERESGRVADVWMEYSQGLDTSLKVVNRVNGQWEAHYPTAHLTILPMILLELFFDNDAI